MSNNVLAPTVGLFDATGTWAGVYDLDGKPQIFAGGAGPGYTSRPLVGLFDTAGTFCGVLGPNGPEQLTGTPVGAVRIHSPTLGLFDITTRQWVGVRNRAGAEQSVTLGINGFTYSEQFDNAAWSKNGTTVTANTTVAPDGATTADTVTAPSATSFALCFRGATSAAVQTVSFFLKRGNADWAYLFMDNGALKGAWFNLATGVSGSEPGAGYTVAIQPAANGFYRCSLTGVCGGNTGVGVSNGNGSVDADAAGTVICWGAQLDQGAMTSYKPRTT